MGVGLFTAGLYLLNQQSTSRRARPFVVARIAMGVTERSSFLGQRFPVSHNGIGAVTAETCGIGYARHGKVGVVEEFRQSSRRILVPGCFRRFEHEVNWFVLFLCKTGGLQVCIVVAN